MPQSFYEVLWIFVIYAFIGWCTEVAYAALERGVFVNRGFLNGPYCPIYGCGVLTVVVLLTPLKQNLMLLYIGSFFLTSILEFITGFVLEKMFHNKWWDYSDKPFNIKGYVCLKFSIFWGLACTFIMLIIHPIIYGVIKIVPHILGIIAISLIMICFMVDVTITVMTIIRFNRRLRLMNELADKLKVISNEIGENVYENVMIAMEKKENFVESHGELIDGIEERKEVLTENMGNMRSELENHKEIISDSVKGLIRKKNLRVEQEELKQKLIKLYNKKNRISSRLMKAYPDMKSLNHNEILQKLKNRYR